MTNNGLSSLYEALTQEPGPHLTDEILAEVATAETAGENIDSLYPVEMQHIETCVDCAEAYSELAEMMLTAVDEMVARAEAVSPLEVYATLIERAISNQVTNYPEISTLIKELAARLPAYFTHLPETETKTNSIEGLVNEIVPATDQISAVIIHGMRQNLSALSIYLESAANAAWGRTVRVMQELSDNWHNLSLSLGPQYRTATLGEFDELEEWPLLRLQSGQPLPVQVTAWAERLSPLACKVYVQVDRPGLISAAGRKIELDYGGQIITAHTDEKGIVSFEPVPVVAVPQAIVRFES